MKNAIPIFIVTLSFTLPGTAMSENAVNDADTGLSKTSVFDAPTPIQFKYNDKFPGTSQILPRAYPGAPPQIPHFIGNLKPVTAEKNLCMGCHNNPGMRGKTMKGMATPMPESHYTDYRHAPNKVSDQMIGARYVCTQCHVPQSDAKKLVDNTFDEKN